MNEIKTIVSDHETSIRVYLLKKRGNKGQYDAVLFPNALNEKIRETYAHNFENYSADREIREYDSVHSEKGTIKKLKTSDLSRWEGMREAIARADAESVLLNKSNFTDDYSVIVLVYEKRIASQLKTVYLLSQYRKIESWYKRSILFGFVANTIQQKDTEIFVLNGCIDTVIFKDNVFVLQEGPFEKVFNYYEKAKKTVAAHKETMQKWRFLDNPQAFYDSVSGKKLATTKLARAIQKSEGVFDKLEPTQVKQTLSQYEEFNELAYDAEDRIMFSSEVRDLIIDILRQSYTRNLFSDSLIHTKGV